VESLRTIKARVGKIEKEQKALREILDEDDDADNDDGDDDGDEDDDADDGDDDEDADDDDDF
jgi:hypothetical protein